MNVEALSNFEPIPVQVTHAQGRTQVVSLSLGAGATACACSGAGGKKPPEVRNFDILDVAEVVALEHALEAQGTPLAQLMDCAGASLAAFVAQAFSAPARVMVLCGSGNNGGDGWVAARLLAEAGFKVELVTPRRPESIRVEPARSAALRAARDAECVAHDDVLAVYAFNKGALGAEMTAALELESRFKSCDVIVDCLLGTGFDGGAVKEPVRTIIERANTARAFKIACDVPSGMSAQTAMVEDLCVRADVTITMLAVKTGLARSEAASFTGRLLLAPLVTA